MQPRGYYSVAFFTAFLLHHALSFPNCPFLGIDFPPPTKLANSSNFQNATSSLLAAVNEAINSGVNGSSFSVEIFSTHDPASLFNFHYSSYTLNSSVGVKTVDSDSLYRIGSISKLFTIYLLLIEAGDVHFHEPITNFVPELLAAPQATSDDDLDFVDWTSVTVGNLASHMSGIGRDYDELGDILNTLPPNFDFTPYGLPALDLSQFPACVLGQNCTNRQEFFNGFPQRRPVFAPSTTPAYSNVAFQILGYALEKITGKSFTDMLNDDIIKPLRLNSTSYSRPENTNLGVIPGTPDSSGWNLDIGDEGPAGSLYSSTTDMVAVARSILSSQILRPVQTSRWMKPLAHSADPGWSFGAPWEIIRKQMSSTSRIVDLYTKNGGIGAYESELVLVPDWNIGFVLLQAGTSPAIFTAFQYIEDIIFPAIETAARQEADIAYSGHYISTNSTLNSSITLATDEAHPGLGVTSWISNGTDMFPVAAALLTLQDPNPSIRLYATGLKKELADGSSQASWRAVVESAPDTTSNFPTCLSSTGVDGVMYGTIALDDFVFTVGSDGIAKSIEPRVLRSSLNRV
ncbi:beta-lactamase/transpeptidase-like protein [Stipitochalara longipes BDJ]|nr:beta-lactamase/transpeptidase-like protein [Stipitochalara longipes BDJ]